MDSKKQPITASSKLNLQVKSVMFVVYILHFERLYIGQNVCIGGIFVQYLPSVPKVKPSAYEVYSNSSGALLTPILIFPTMVVSDALEMSVANIFLKNVSLC